MGAGLGISSLVFGSVGQAHRGAVDDFGSQAIPELLGQRQEPVGLGGDGVAKALEGVQRQAATGLAVAAVSFIDGAQVVEAKEGLDLPDDFAAGAAGIEDLREKAPEGAADRIDALATIGALVGLGQEPSRDELAKELFEVQQAVLAEVLDALAEGGQAGAPGREERCLHDKYIYLSMLDVQFKIITMKTTSSSLSALERRYERLRTSLAQIGYISQGSVLDRSTLKPSRSGYQWTRKVAQKTITVSLSPQQFQSLRQAIENERKLWKTIREMEKISRQILFGTLPDTRRRKPLGKKVLGLN